MKLTNTLAYASFFGCDEGQDRGQLVYQSLPLQPAAEFLSGRQSRSLITLIRPRKVDVLGQYAIATTAAVLQAVGKRQRLALDRHLPRETTTQDGQVSSAHARLMALGARTRLS